ncbi:class I SAM-dependent methyltransferase [Paludibaculum fermentans]|uniref:class I SAM-dependent methyltransferase n=1 Tax=Paludibaculum fermentans TaxID=1473598 RepID=UPI003EBA7C84
MNSSPWDREEMERHDAEAAAQFPGPDYRLVMEWLHELLKPRVYVEIGVYCGDTLRLAAGAEIAVGVDPAAQMPPNHPAEVRIFRTTSDEFFQSGALREICAHGPVDLAFIDGLHLFEQVMKDFHGLARYAGPNSVIAIHDSIPLNAETSTRERSTEFYTGDVWKAVACLHAHRPELRILTVPAAPTGLTLIRGFGGEGSPFPDLDPMELNRFLHLDWTYFRDNHQHFLNLAPNELSTLQSFCQ